METVGDRVKILRNIKNLNQTDFGKKISLSQTAIGQYETNVRKVTDRSIKDMCSVYGASELWLRTGCGEMFVQQDILIVEKIDDIMSGENEFRKKLIKSIVNFNDDEILLLEKIVNELSTNKKNRLNQ